MPFKSCASSSRAPIRLGAKTLPPWWVLLLAATLLADPLSTLGQATQRAAVHKAASPQDVLQQHYAAARTFQLSGDEEHASAEYRAFLSGALRLTAKASVELAQFDQAAGYFDEVLELSPNDVDAKLDYAQLRFQQEKLPEARTLAEGVLASSPDNARAQSLLGQVLFAQGDYKSAREHLEQAVVAAPSFDAAYLLGITYIKLNDFGRARLVFDDMVTGFGDTAQIHITFGRAYKQGGWEALDMAIQELKKALVKDSRAPHAHFLIALAYLDRDGESGFSQAAEELQSELKVSPQDSRSYYLLGYIAMKGHDPKTAEDYLRKAADLDPKNPDPLIYLGQIYSDADRDAEAETTLRKAIRLSANSTPTDYLIGRAHYVLGRLLLKAGNKDEGEKELTASQTIRDQMNRPGAARDSKSKTDPELSSVAQPADVAQPTPVVEAPPQVKEQIQVYMDQLKPAIADAYNNLGVIRAGRKDFVTATDFFRRAGEWNPSLETLDRNWGMAAFYGNKFQDAVPPLTRQLQKHPDDVRVRAALALSLFSLQNFAATLETLKPMKEQIDDDPGLSYAYAVSLVKTGDYDQGMTRLKSLADADPKSADLHMLLGSAYADQHEYDTALAEYRKALAIDPSQSQTHYLAGLALIRSGHPQDAVNDLRAALKLAPSDAAVKYHLAFSLIQIQQKQEAESLLHEVIQQDPNRADAYYELGKLQLEQGDTKDAVASLETGTKVSPEADYIHYQLAMAYRRESRSEDAEREIKVYQTLKNRQRGRTDAPQSD
jgi:tetratricopeptide (TPR) repeat protein